MEMLVVNATKTAVEEFKESILWADIVRELENWRLGFQMEMMSIPDRSADENLSTASILMHMGDINGRVKAVDYMLTILDVFTDVLGDKKEEQDEPEEES